MAKFTVELGDTHGRCIAIGVLRQTFRGRFSIPDLHMNDEGAPDVGSKMSGMPVVPGMHVEFDTTKRTVHFSDPLAKDDKVMARINKTAKNAYIVNENGFKPCEPFELNDSNLGEDKFKTLLIEFCNRNESSPLFMAEGEFPTRDQIEKLPGKELFDVWHSSANKKRYASDPDFRQAVPTV